MRVSLYTPDRSGVTRAWNNLVYRPVRIGKRIYWLMVEKLARREGWGALGK